MQGADWSPAARLTCQEGRNSRCRDDILCKAVRSVVLHILHIRNISRQMLHEHIMLFKDDPVKGEPTFVHCDCSAISWILACMYSASCSLILLTPFLMWHGNDDPNHMASRSACIGVGPCLTSKVLQDAHCLTLPHLEQASPWQHQIAQHRRWQAYPPAAFTILNWRGCLALQPS